MNRVHYNPMISLKLLLLFIPALGLSGCLTASEMRHAIIYEKLAPQKVFCNNDGSIAIKVTSHYYSYSSLDHDGYIPLPEYPPSERYLVLHPSEVMAFINHERAVNNGTPRGLPDWPISVSWPAFSKETMIRQLYPGDFFAPASGMRLEPVWLRSGGVKEYPFGKAVSYQAGNAVVYLQFDRAPEIDLGRKSLKWGRLPPLSLALAVDSAMIVTMAPFVLIAVAFDR